MPKIGPQRPPALCSYSLLPWGHNRRPSPVVENLEWHKVHALCRSPSQPIHDNFSVSIFQIFPVKWLMQTRKIHMPSCRPATMKCRAELKCRPRGVADLGDWNLWKAGLRQCQMFKLEITCKTSNVQLNSKRFPDYFWPHFHLVLLVSMHKTTNHSDQSRSQSLGFWQCQVESSRKVTSAVNPLSRVTKFKSTHLLRERWLFRQKPHS